MTVALSSSPAAPSSKAVYSAHLTNGDPSKASATYRPTHPGRFEVSFQSGSYNSSLVTQRRFAKDETLAMMDAAEYCNEKRYSTVQVAQDKHIELNSECVRAREQAQRKYVLLTTHPLAASSTSTTRVSPLSASRSMAHATLGRQSQSVTLKPARHSPSVSAP